MKKIIQIIPAILLFGIIGVLSWTNRDIFINRVLYEDNGEQFIGFIPGVETEFASDSIQKGEFLDLYSAMENVLGINEVNNVSRLANNWLVNDSTNYDYTEDLADNIAELSDYLAEEEINFLCVPVMSKENFYDISYRAGYESDDHGKIEALYEMLSERDVPLVNLDQFYQENGWSMEETYFKTDHHWTPKAAFAAVEEIVKTMAATDEGITYDESSFSEENWTTETYQEWFLGSWGKRTGSKYVGVDDLDYIHPAEDLANLVVDRIDEDGNVDVANQNTIYMTEYLDEPDYYEENPYCLYLGDNYPMAYIRNEDAVNDAKVVVVGDSYRMTAECFLASQFTEVYHIDMRVYQDGTFMEFMESLHPDYVLLLFNGNDVDASGMNIHNYGVLHWQLLYGNRTVDAELMGDAVAEISESEEGVRLTDVERWPNLETADAADKLVDADSGSESMDEDSGSESEVADYLKLELTPGSYRLTLGDISLTRDSSVNEEPISDLVQLSVINPDNGDVVQSRYFIAGYEEEQDWYFSIPDDGVTYDVMIFNGLKGDSLGNMCKISGIHLERYLSLSVVTDQETAEGISSLPLEEVIGYNPSDDASQYSVEDLSLTDPEQSDEKPYIYKVIGEEADYLLLDGSKISIDPEYVASYGLEFVTGTSGGYQLYYNTKKYTNLYTITNYPQVNGAQGLCYTIEDAKGHFAIVDGGWQDESELLLNVIVEHGAHLDAWIVTHPHRDHVEAFNHLMSGEFDIKIDTVYAIDMDYEAYQKVANDMDGGFEYYEDFLSVTEGWDNIQYVQTGDTYDLFGLQMDILSALDCSDEEFYDDLANNGSIMFCLSSPEKKMLFCADVTDKMYDRLTSLYSDEELHADILQVSHHGNGACLRAEFNSKVAPEIAFIDMNGELRKTQEEAATIADTLEAEGVTVYNFDAAIRSMEFR